MVVKINTQYKVALTRAEQKKTHPTGVSAKKDTSERGMLRDMKRRLFSTFFTWLQVANRSTRMGMSLAEKERLWR